MSTPISPAPDADNAATRRASGRVRRQPEHFASSPQGAAKRKRDEQVHAGDDDEEMIDAEDDEEDDEDEDDPEDEPDEEEIRETAKKSRKAKKPAAARKPPQKKPRTQTNGLSLPIRSTAKAPARKRALKKPQAIDGADAEAAGGIYAELFARDQTVDEVVAGWLAAFKDNEALAMTDLINFLLKSAGCKIKVDEHDIGDPDGATEKLRDIQGEHQATKPTEYPLVAKGKSGTAFRHTISYFVQQLIKSIHAAGILINNPEVLDNISVWFSTMSSASDRSFRHTATVVSLNVVTAMCEIARDLAKQAPTLQRQADAEKKKARVNKARVKDIEEKAKQANLDLEYMEALLKDWFDVIFIHRYRDVDPLVRRECAEAMGDWIMARPEHFFDGHHLRYLGWILSDSQAACRQEVIKQLRRLYTDENKLGGLRTFTEKFRQRLVEVGTADADMTVRMAGIELLDTLRKNDLLEPDDVDTIGRLVFHDEIRNVNDSFSVKVDEMGGIESLQENLPEVSEDNFEAPRLSWLKLKSLAELLQSYDNEDPGASQFERSGIDGSLVINVAGTESRFTLAVNALYDKIDEFREWQRLAGYLLFDHSRGRSNGASDDALSQLKHECILSEKEELILLEVLNATVKRSLSDLAEQHVHHSKGKLSKKQKEELQDELEEDVRHLTDILPRLLKKFGDTPGTAAAVLRLEGVFATPALQSLRADPTVNSALLDDLRKQFMSHGTEDVLGPATNAILHAKSYGDIDDTAVEKLSGLWEDVVSNLAELLNPTTLTVRGASSQEELVALSNNLLRIGHLASISNPVGPMEDESVAANNESIGKSYEGAIDFIIDLLQRAVHSTGPAPEPEEAVLEDLIAARAAQAALFYFRWKFSALLTAVTTGATSELDDLETLCVRRDTYVTNIMMVLDGRKAVENVCYSLTGALLDLYTSGAVLRTVNAKAGVSEDYTVLIMDFDAEHESAVVRIFTALEKDFAKLAGKRLENSVKEDDEEMDVDADPIDDDPVSDSEEDDEDPRTQASQQARDAKLARPLIAEQKLCVLTAKIVQADAAGVIVDKATCQRVERNKTKLGPNFKEVVAYLDKSALDKKAAGKSKAKPKAGKAPANGTAKKAKAGPKSNAIVAEDEVDDEIEDDEEDAEAEPPEPEDEDRETVNGAAAEEESLLGD
ncbi:Putative armadillo-like helical, stromalin conservative domain, cohesin subunit Scc3/SA [Septoria linicola]|uniref:Armadillo-like helical, stromalin conservative domain, cohesin subunit Scc3/SA n=1 Tax=Septoria linicola TaxID=215465 RepID=A0A9Q9ASP9_9PEZI|nr:Putative armadillo-like helical, stromalin conservative domain, cohesin subunit Scc3/SA [Septoria linicola]